PCYFNNGTIFTNIYPLDFGQLYYCCTFSLISIFLCVLVNLLFCGVDKATCEVNKATESSSKYALRQKQTIEISQKQKIFDTIFFFFSPSLLYHMMYYWSLVCKSSANLV
ncbi:hypothetical protein PanWU01x14_258280, partial [Parasponia andersonii]